MKKFLILCILFMSSFQVGAWEKIISCDNDAIVIDKECQFSGEFPVKYTCQYQVVLNEKKIINYLFRNNGNKEQIIFQVNANEGYGKFSTGINYQLDKAKIEIDEIEYGTLKLATFVFATRGSSFYPNGNWTFRSCISHSNY